MRLTDAARDTLGCRRELRVGSRRVLYHSLAAAEAAGIGAVSRLPFSLKMLLENLLRHEDGGTVTVEDIRALGDWAQERAGGREVAFHPSRVLMQDSAGLPALADLAAMRDALGRWGGAPAGIAPVIPVDLVVDHSVEVDVAGSDDALRRNGEIEFARNRERYAFLRWAAQAFEGLRIVPPGNGICHQVNLEYLAPVVACRGEGDALLAFPDSLLGTDSHTTMVNALGVFGWGCGGIEAAAAMLGQPVALRLPEVIGVRLLGRLPPGATSTDLVLTATAILRRRRLVDKFVEFCGPGLDGLSLPDRASLANMAPEYGATMGFFPIDRATIAYLRATARDAAQIELVEAYARAQGLWRDAADAEPAFTEIVEIDLATVEPSVAGPRRPQDRLGLSAVPASLDAALAEQKGGRAPRRKDVGDRGFALSDGDIVIAAITSCTNTSNPAAMLGAGLLARNAARRGLGVKPWVKTSLAPGSRVVADYLAATGLQASLDALGFNLVGFGCTTCMGNSGPLDPAIDAAIEEGRLVVGAVLSGNRNFEGRIHPRCRVNYLASPALVVAYALSGSLCRDVAAEPLGIGSDGRPVHLAEIWPADAEIAALLHEAATPGRFRANYEAVFAGSAQWQGLPTSSGAVFAWDPASHYIRRPPFFDAATPEPPPLADIEGARILALLGDSVTTDHISPVSAIPREGPAGRYLMAQGIAPRDFNSFSGRRINHDVMARGTFANIRLKNEMAPGTSGGVTRLLPGGEIVSIFAAATAYAEAGTPLVVVAGNAYGTGSARDWAAKGTRLLGVKAVIAEGFERIHRANLAGMGVLPLQFPDRVDRKSLRLDGSETVDVTGIGAGLAPGQRLAAHFHRGDGTSESVSLICRLDTAYEVEYHRNGGILDTVLRGVFGGG
jgi:aconitate hydratase